MSTFLIDVGNTRIKWARLTRGGVLQRQRASTYAAWTARDVDATVFGRTQAIDRVVAVSVAPASITEAVRAAARARGIADVSFVESARRLGAVTTRYAEPWRLGADRLVAAIGAFAIAGRRGACLVDVGTAMTVDLVDSQGVHRGGAIIPGPQLMVSSLLEETDGIGKRAVPSAARRRRPAAREFFVRATRDAIETGARFAAAAAIDRAVLESRASLGHMPLVLLTGGAAPLVAPLLRTPRVRHVPDLVLQGLAVLAKTPLR